MYIVMWRMEGFFCISQKHVNKYRTSENITCGMQEMTQTVAYSRKGIFGHPGHHIHPEKIRHHHEGRRETWVYLYIETNVWIHKRNLSWDFSHELHFLLWKFTWEIWREISRMKFHRWKLTYDRQIHMWNFTCGTHDLSAHVFHVKKNYVVLELHILYSIKLSYTDKRISNNNNSDQFSINRYKGTKKH